MDDFDVAAIAYTVSQQTPRTEKFDHHKFAADEAQHHRVRKYNPTRSRQQAMRMNRIKKGTLKARGSS